MIVSTLNSHNYVILWSSAKSKGYLLYVKISHFNSVDLEAEPSSHNSDKKTL